MLSTNLCKKMYFKSQAKEIAGYLNCEDVSITEDEVIDIMRCRKVLYVNVDSQRNITTKLISSDKTDTNGCVLMKRSDSDDYVSLSVINLSDGALPEPGEYFTYGSDAISYLLSTYCENFVVKTIDRVEVPVEVYHMCNPYIWLDISMTMSYLISCNERYKSMLDTDMPAAILLSGEANLWVKLQQLECNEKTDKYPRRMEGGIAARALSDVGYSLVNGWSHEVRDYFVKLEQQRIKESDDMIKFFDEQEKKKKG